MKRYDLKCTKCGQAACQCSKVSPPSFQSEEIKCGPFSPYAHGLVDTDEIELEVFEGGGLRVNWPLSGPDLNEEIDILEPLRPESDDLRALRASNEQSTKSRLNAAWKIGNSVDTWSHMTTLTYPVSRVPKEYEETRAHRHNFLKRVGKAFPGTRYAWILEFTEKKAAHYHVFWSGTLAEALKDSPTEFVMRRPHEGQHKVKTEIVRGDIDKRIVSWWRNQAGDGSQEFEKFQNGGITEVIRHPEGAARYAAKEAAKRTQKHAPFLVSQWWGMSNKSRPKQIGTRKISVGAYVAMYGPVMLRNLFDC